MSLKDDLEGISMKQTKEYKEEAPSTEESIDEVNEVINNGGKKERPNPFKKEEDGENKLNPKKAIIGLGILILVVVVGFGATQISKKISSNKGASFLDDMEDEIASFKYDMEERELLRANGYTGDDIERYEVEEINPYQLIREAEARRKEINDNEIAPYLDGASDKYKELEAKTWLGTGPMSPNILNTEEVNYEQRYGSYNCDYEKIPPMGSQLFLKVHALDFNKVIFMTVTSERYNELEPEGNIVVDIEYNKYEDDSILVTNVYEKDIRK